jgi:hypothetical protein
LPDSGKHQQDIRPEHVAVDRMCSANAIHCKDKQWRGGEKSKNNPDEIELVKRSEAHDDVRCCALCLDMAEEYREADEDIYEDDICRRRAQCTNEKNPRVNCENVMPCDHSREWHAKNGGSTDDRPYSVFPAGEPVAFLGTLVEEKKPKGEFLEMGDS